MRRSQISTYELGKTAPRKKTLERLAAAVGVPLGEALEVLPLLCRLVRAVYGRPVRPIDPAVRIGRAAADFFLLEVPLAITPVRV